MDAASKETNTTATVSKPPQSQSHPRRQHPRHRRKVYGYALKDAWLIQYATRHNLGTADNAYVATQHVLSKIMRETRMGSFCIARYDNGGRETGLCLRIGSNWLPSRMTGATRERVEMVKRALEMEEEPRWYVAE